MAEKPNETHPLDKMREPFPEHQISKLPKETGAQAKQRKAAQDGGNWPKKCEACGGYHHERAVHLDYVGHAALTDRLLDTDTEWTWEPLALDANGLPAFDRNGGLWIKLTIHGVTRLGYGDAEGKTGGNAVKEAIGDALRNAAMRFGAALDLWHKGDLHLDEDAEPEKQQRVGINKDQLAKIQNEITRTGTDIRALCNAYGVNALADLSASQFADAMSVLRRRSDKPTNDLDDSIPEFGEN